MHRWDLPTAVGAVRPGDDADGHRVSWAIVGAHGGSAQDHAADIHAGSAVYSPTGLRLRDEGAGASQVTGVPWVHPWIR